MKHYRFEILGILFLLILAEVIGSDADFLCSQEVDVAQYEEFFLENLSERDYDGAYWPKSRAKHTQV